MKGPATELIHAGEADLCLAVPLTTPIYETTTFVFDAAQEVLAYNEGRSQKYLYSRYSNPTIVSVEKKLAVTRATRICTGGPRPVSVCRAGRMPASDVNAPLSLARSK